MGMGLFLWIQLHVIRLDLVAFVFDLFLLGGQLLHCFLHLLERLFVIPFDRLVLLVRRVYGPVQLLDLVLQLLVFGVQLGPVHRFFLEFLFQLLRCFLRRARGTSETLGVWSFIFFFGA